MGSLNGIIPEMVFAKCPPLCLALNVQSLASHVWEGIVGCTPSGQGTMPAGTDALLLLVPVCVSSVSPVAMAHSGPVSIGF